MIVTRLLVGVYTGLVLLPTRAPPFSPIQMYHLGLWFNSPKDATAAGCGGAITPFNGEHNAGVQALSTRNFPDQAAALRQITFLTTNNSGGAVSPCPSGTS